MFFFFLNCRFHLVKIPIKIFAHMWNGLLHSFIIFLIWIQNQDVLVSYKELGFEGFFCVCAVFLAFYTTLFWFFESSGFAELLFVTKLCRPCFLCLCACSVAFSNVQGKVLGSFIFNLFYFLINAFRAINIHISNIFSVSYKLTILRFSF